MDRETRRRFAAWRAEEATDPRTPWSTTSSPASATAPDSSSARHVRPVGVGDVRCAARRRRGARRLRAEDARQGRRASAHRHDAPSRRARSSRGHTRRRRAQMGASPASSSTATARTSRSSRAGRELEPERQRQRVDVQAAPGRQVRQRQAHDRRRRHRDVSPAAHGRDVAGRLGLQRRALGCRVSKVDDFTIKFKLDTPTSSFRTSPATPPIRPSSPQDYVGPFEKTPQTTGAFNLVAYTPE